MDYDRPHSITQRLYKILWLGIVSTVALLLFFTIFYWIRPPLPKPEKAFHNVHLIGGFSTTTPERALKAATMGIQVEFQYGNPPTENSNLGQKLNALHMKVVDGFIAGSLHYYECQRSRSMTPLPPALNTYCAYAYPKFNSEEAFLAAIAAHLQYVASNHLIIGYWVLDDWAPWDKGGARQLLVKIHNLIQQFTPDLPAICGFGGALTPNHTSGWADWVADNFSPDGCDEVGLYIYATSILATNPIPAPETYDWSMSSILPTMFRSLQQRGWNKDSEPFIGIGQAFGGPLANSNRYPLAPTAKYVAMQSKSFCAHGAIGEASQVGGRRGIEAMSQERGGEMADIPGYIHPTADVETGAEIGAGAIIVCGITIGAYALVGAGAVVTRDVAPIPSSLAILLARMATSAHAPIPPHPSANGWIYRGMVRIFPGTMPGGNIFIEPLMVRNNSKCIFFLQHYERSRRGASMRYNS